MMLKLGMQHQRLKLYKVYINDDPGMTLTYCATRSNRVAYTFDTKVFDGENLQQMTKMTEYLFIVLMKRNNCTGLSAPALGLNTCI